MLMYFDPRGARIEVRDEQGAVLAEAGGEAEWEMTTSSVRFTVEIEDVPTGSYLLRVGGAQNAPSAGALVYTDDILQQLLLRRLLRPSI